MKYLYHMIQILLWSTACVFLYQYCTDPANQIKITSSVDGNAYEKSTKIQKGESIEQPFSPLYESMDSLEICIYYENPAPSEAMLRFELYSPDGEILTELEMAQNHYPSGQHFLLSVGRKLNTELTYHWRITNINNNDPNSLPGIFLVTAPYRFAEENQPVNIAQSAVNAQAVCTYHYKANEPFKILTVGVYLSVLAFILQALCRKILVRVTPDVSPGENPC